MAGGPAELARSLNPPIRGQAISQWERIPALRVLEIERILEGQVTRYEMRPDVFGTKRQARAELCGRSE